MIVKTSSDDESDANDHKGDRSNFVALNVRTSVGTRVATDSAQRG